MDDTESSDFLSSGSLYSASTNSTDQDNPNYVGFEVFQSDSVSQTVTVEQDYENVRLIPNSRLNSSSHPVLVRLENEYQARRSFWQQHTAQYCRYSADVEERTSCPSKSNEDKQLKDLVFPDGSHQGLKRQRRKDNKSPEDWWKERKEQNLPVSDGDRIFAQKCRELQGFVKPLTELLNGLKRGRYDRGLSSFQQSVAMDRIQRIVGVLQKPEMGERYLGTLLQVEMMLKIWFPGVASSASASSSSSSSSDFEMEEPQSKIAKHPEVGATEQKSCQLRQPANLNIPVTSKQSQCHAMAPAHTDCPCCKERIQVLAEWPTMNLTWMHTAPISNPALSQIDLHRLNTALVQDFWPNGNNCGIIFLVPNSQASMSSTSESVVKGETPLDLWQSREETQDQSPVRSHSAPAVFVLGDKPDLEQMKSHSHSLPHLPTYTQTSGGEKT
ncbi:circadian-associated transcriptional repressor [Hyperolius riggenbachi]|uniref:circadian-associated transcriptional repressor n=1 Tax=Hyperolius riggenbachi TaxID=752182 RepID=UPI0035A38DFB